MLSPLQESSQLPSSAPTACDPDIEATLRARVAELEAIVAGRAVPPTPAEVLAHEAAGGYWRVVCLVFEVSQTLHGHALNERMLDGTFPHHWWALDRKQRPTAWPCVAVAR